MVSRPDQDLAVTALMATGLTRWQALVESFRGGLVPASLRGVPEGLLCDEPDTALMARFIRQRLAEKPSAAMAFLKDCCGDRVVRGPLDLSDCPRLTALPEGLTIDGELVLTGCRNLSGLPEGLRATAIHLQDCVKLKSIPEGLAMVGHESPFLETLNLSRCEGLERLPDGVRVRGTLWLDGCTSLKALPKGLNVGTLYIRSCPAWDGRIPDDAAIRHGLVTASPPDPDAWPGISLPEWRKLHPDGIRP
jgi:hypothetical protein